MKELIKSISISLIFLVLCGIVYPLGITGINQLLFPRQSNGSMLDYKGNPVGSELLGQAFSDTRFFHGRVSSINYNTYFKEDNAATENQGVSSGSANLSVSNPALVDRLEKDIDEFLKLHPETKKKDIPLDLLSSSGSGLDPHISPEGARIQIPLISKVTGIGSSDLEKIVEAATEGKVLGVFGEPGVNVLKANVEIEKALN